MVGSPVAPRILSVPSSSVSLTVMYPDWFSSGPGFEKTYGFLKMVSGHPVVRLHHPEKGRQASECQCGSTGCIKAQPVASVCIGGDGGHLGDGDGSGWVGTLRLLGRMRGRCSLFILQTTSSIFGGCLWPDRSGSGHDEGKVRPSTVQSHPSTALNILL